VNGPSSLRTALVVACVALACAPPPTPPRHATTAAPPAADAAPPLGVYLPKERAAGSPYCLDPDGAALRRAVAHARWEPNERVSAPALAEDVRDLHDAMEKIYAGYPELLEDPGFDVERFFDGWEAGLRAAGPTVSFANGVVAPLVALRRAHRDNHLAPWGWNGRLARRPELAIAEYQARRHFTHEELASCAFADARPLPGTLRAARGIDASGLVDLATFSAQSTAEAIVARCGGADVRFERRRSSTTYAPSDAPVYAWRLVNDVAVIVVRRLFGPPADLATLRRLADDYPAHAAAKAIVFDFRGNGGGDDSYVHAWIDRAVRGRWRPPYFEIGIVGARKPCGDWNELVAAQLRDGRADLPDARAARDAYWKKAALVTPDSVQSVDLADETASAPSPYRGRVFVLADRTSGSSGESGPEMLRASIGATLVGERTAGYLEYGNIRPWVMPRTGIVWGLASKRNYYPEPCEGVGLAPTYYLAPELVDAPVEKLLPLLLALPAAARP